MVLVRLSACGGSGRSGFLAVCPACVLPQMGGTGAWNPGTYPLPAPFTCQRCCLLFVGLRLSPQLGIGSVSCSAELVLLKLRRQERGTLLVPPCFSLPPAVCFVRKMLCVSGEQSGGDVCLRQSSPGQDTGLRPLVQLTLAGGRWGFTRTEPAAVGVAWVCTLGESPLDAAVAATNVMSQNSTDGLS